MEPDDHSVSSSKKKKKVRKDHNIIVPDDVQETGRIFVYSKKKNAVVKEGMEQIAKMTLQESIKPDQGVTLFECTDDKKPS